MMKNNLILENKVWEMTTEIMCQRTKSNNATKDPDCYAKMSQIGLRNAQFF